MAVAAAAVATSRNAWKSSPNAGVNNLGPREHRRRHPVLVPPLAGRHGRFRRRRRPPWRHRAREPSGRRERFGRAHRRDRNHQRGDASRECHGLGGRVAPPASEHFGLLHWLSGWHWAPPPTHHQPTTNRDAAAHKRPIDRRQVCSSSSSWSRLGRQCVELKLVALPTSGASRTSSALASSSSWLLLPTALSPRHSARERGRARRSSHYSMAA